MALKRWMCTTVLMMSLLAGATAAKSDPLSGTWYSSLGNLELVTFGNDVEGTYQHGQLPGTINGRMLYSRTLFVGTWKLEDTQGGFALRILEGGDAFVGEWWPEGQPADRHSWIGVRRDAPVVANSDPAAIGGDWRTNYGDMAVNVDAGAVQATYRGAYNDGSLVGEWQPGGKWLLGTWADQHNRGRVKLRLLRGGNGFVGEWWYRDNRYGGIWYGVRPAAVTGCIDGNCEDGRGTYVWLDGHTYRGEWRRSLYHGNGALVDGLSGVVRKGIWIEGVYQGDCIDGDCLDAGTMAYVDGSRYTGAFVGFLPEGNGERIEPGLGRYSGEFRKGIAHGTGQLTFENGDRYEGGFLRGLPHGEGVYLFADQTRYEGRFYRGLRHGQGVQIWPTGHQYSGEWRSDRLVGEGEMRYPDGSRFAGKFQDGLREGQGTLFRPDGGEYHGEWVGDLLRTDIHAGGQPTTLPTAPVPGQVHPVASPGDAFLVYAVERSHRTAAPDAREREEIRLRYFVVENAGDLKPQDAVALIGERTRTDPASLSVTSLRQGLPDIQKLVERYRMGIDRPRVHAQGDRIAPAPADSSAGPR